MTEEKDPFASMPSRGVGLFMLLAGSALAYVGVIAPLRALAAGAPSVRVYLSAIALGPLVLGLGLTYSLLGPTAERWLGHPQRPTRTGWVVAAVLTALGLGLYFWVRALLRGNGYEG